LSKVAGLFISSVPGSLDTSGTNRRPLGYTITTGDADTGKNFYSLLGLTASAGTSYSGVSATWNLNPLRWITFGSRSISNVPGAFAAPYLKLGPSMDSTLREHYYLTATFNHPQTGYPMTDQVLYEGVPPGIWDYVDNVALSTSRLGSGIIGSLRIRGDINYLRHTPGRCSTRWST